MAIRTRVLSLLFLAAVLCAPARAAETGGLLAKGTRWETPYYIVAASRSGPTVLISGGIHGNEPAGAYAAGQVRHWPLLRGRLAVIPRCNVPGLEASSRRMPGVPKKRADANRNFPAAADEKPTGELCAALWAFAARLKPDYHLDLHEGYGYRGAGSQSVGSSIIAVPDKETKRLRDLMLEAVNATVENPAKKFVALRGGATGSFARGTGAVLGAKSMICETTWREDPSGKDRKSRQPLSRRIRQHRIIVHRLLRELAMVDCPVERMLPDPQPGDPPRLAIYNGPGTKNDTFLGLEKLFARRGTMTVRPVGPADIRGGALGQFDAVVFPGGSGSKQARALGDEGRRRVIAFVKEGGGFMGICAGAYLASADYSWSLKIADVKVIDRKHWKRGTGVIKMEMTAAGQAILGKRKQMDIYYANGPLLAPAGRDDLPDGTVLARYRTEITEHGPAGVMKDTPAVVAGVFGRGRVILFGPHPEKKKSEEGAEVLLINAARHCAGGAQRALKKAS